MNDTISKVIVAVVGLLIAFSLYSLSQANRYERDGMFLLDKQTGKLYSIEQDTSDKKKARWVLETEIE